MKEQDVVYPRNELLLGLRKKGRLKNKDSATTQMSLEAVMLTEISQTLKDQYCTIPLP